MKLAEKIEHIEYFLPNEDKPWKDYSHSRKFYKKMQHKVWRRWLKNKRNLEENPLYNRYKGWEY